MEEGIDHSGLRPVQESIHYFESILERQAREQQQKQKNKHTMVTSSDAPEDNADASAATERRSMPGQCKDVTEVCFEALRRRACARLVISNKEGEEAVETWLLKSQPNVSRLVVQHEVSCFEHQKRWLH